MVNWDKNKPVDHNVRLQVLNWALVARAFTTRLGKETPATSHQARDGKLDERMPLLPTGEEEFRGACAGIRNQIQPE